MNKTTQKSHKTIKRETHTIDASGKVLGRLSSEIAKLLMGKHKVDYSPNLDMGDNVVVTNAAKVTVTGRKEEQKVYYKHSGFPGGFKEVKYAKLKDEQPAKVIQIAVKGMLPKNRLQKTRLTRLTVFAAEQK
jgi:large subunit ribosomal protein L13